MRYARRPLMAVGARRLSGVAQRQYLIQFMHDMAWNAMLEVGAPFRS